MHDICFFVCSISPKNKCLYVGTELTWILNHDIFYYDFCITCTSSQNQVILVPPMRSCFRYFVKTAGWSSVWDPLHPILRIRLYKYIVKLILSPYLDVCLWRMKMLVLTGDFGDWTTKSDRACSPWRNDGGWGKPKN